MSELKEGQDILIKGKVDYYRPDTKKALVKITAHLGSEIKDWFEEEQYVVPVAETKSFRFKRTDEFGVSTLWLCFENGMINLNNLAEKRSGIVGKMLNEAIAKALETEFK